MFIFCYFFVNFYRAMHVYSAVSTMAQCCDRTARGRYYVKAAEWFKLVYWYEATLSAS